MGSRGLEGVSRQPESPGFINSGWRNKFYIRLCALLLFQTRALGTVDISDGRVLVTKRSVDLSQSLVRNVGGPVFLSPRPGYRHVFLRLSHPHLCLSLPYSPLRLISSSLLPPFPPGPPALLAASLGAASTSSPRQEYKDLDDLGCSGQPSGVTTNFKASLFYDAAFQRRKPLSRAPYPASGSDR